MRSSIVRSLPFVAVFAVLATGLTWSQHDQPATESRGTPATVQEQAVPAVATTADAPAADGIVAELAPRELKPFSLLGVTWKDGVGDAAHVEVRWRSHGTWTDWTDLHSEPSTEGRPGTEPQWVGSADAAAVRVVDTTGESRPVGLSLSTVQAGTSPTARPAAASVGQPTIIMRSQWGARAVSSCDSPRYGPKTRGAVIHHTAGSNTYTASQSAGILRATQAYHMDSRGWCDIGYNFLIDKYGQTFEGRSGGITKPVRAAHSGNDAVNQGTVGISLMGTFTSTAPSAAMQTATANLVAWRFSIGGVVPTGTYSIGGITLNRIAGHRNVVSTECPGLKAYEFVTGNLRTAVAQRLQPKDYSFSPPTGVKVAKKGATQLKLSWNAVTGTKVRYWVRVSTKKDLSDPTLFASDTNSVTATGLKPETTYYVGVKISPPGGDAFSSHYSSPISTTTDTYDPPADLTVAERQSTTAKLSWEPVAESGVRYWVRVSTSKDLSNATLQSFDTAGGTLTGLKPETQYYVGVKASPAGGDAYLSQYSDAVSAKTSKVDSPAGLKVTGSSATQVELSWDSVSSSSPVQYWVRASTEPDLSNPTLTEVKDGTSVTVIRLAPGTTYYLGVKVSPKGGDASWSGYTVPVKVTTGTVADRSIEAPSNLRVTTRGANVMDLAWDAAKTDEDVRYWVRASKSPDLSNSTLFSFDEPQGRLTGLSPSTPYWFAVKVSPPGGTAYWSAYSAPVAASTYGSSAPSGLKVVARQGTSLQLDWAPMTNSRYRVRATPTSGSAPTVTRVMPWSQGTVTGLRSDTAYAIDVQALATDGATETSPFSRAVSARTYRYDAPTGVTATRSGTSLRVSWTPVASSGVRYWVRVSRSKDLSNARLYPFDAATGRATGLASSTATYYVGVKVSPPGGDAGWSAYSTPVAVR